MWQPGPPRQTIGWQRRCAAAAACKSKLTHCTCEAARCPAVANVSACLLLFCPRWQAIVAELTKLGASVEEGHDFCVITPPKEVRLCAFVWFEVRYQ